MRLDHQDLEHQHRVVRRTAALRAVRIAKRRLQIGAEELEIHHRRIRLELVTNVAQTLQPFLNVKNPGCVAMTASNTHASTLNHSLHDLAR